MELDKNTKLDALYIWFDENRDSIIAEHSGECVLLKDYTVIGYFPNDNTALEYAQKTGFIMGDFLIQDCISANEDTLYLL
jgi:hypothetical protein